MYEKYGSHAMTRLPHQSNLINWVLQYWLQEEKKNNHIFINNIHNYFFNRKKNSFAQHKTKRHLKIVMRTILRLSVCKNFYSVITTTTSRCHWKILIIFFYVNLLWVKFYIPYIICKPIINALINWVINAKKCLNIWVAQLVCRIEI